MSKKLVHQEEEPSFEIRASRGMSHKTKNIFIGVLLFIIVILLLIMSIKFEKSDFFNIK